MSIFKRLGLWFLLTALVVTGAQITFATGAIDGDFNNDGVVNLTDFLAFARMFGTSQGEAGYDARGDFDNDGSIDLSDFLAFAENFGKAAPSSGAGGPVTVVGTEGSEGDQLIFRSFKVSETRLNARQGFTMETNVQKPQAVGLAHEIKYYRSLDASIDSSDALIHIGWLGPLFGDRVDTTAVLDWTAPAYAGTYHYGVCVAVGSGPSYYCSIGVPVTVDGSHEGSPDLIVHPSILVPDNVTPGSRFTWGTRIENIGTGPAAATSWRGYISHESTIDASDTLFQISSVLPLDSGKRLNQNLTASSPNKAGTYYLGVCVDPVPGETKTDNNCSVGTRLTIEDRGSPDLIVRGLVLREHDRTAREIGLLAHVLNAGDRAADETVARIYRSDDAVIDASDTQVSTDNIRRLGADGNYPAVSGLDVPASPGTYYYGVCVDRVAGETDTNNNCSEAVSLNVGVPDLVFGPAWVSTSNPLAGQSFTLTATVRNEGPEAAAATTVRYYRSDDATIDVSDTRVATGTISGLTGIDGLVLGPNLGPERRRAAFAASRKAVTLNAPSSPGTYYYGACVDGVPGETDTDNNCSAGAYVRVVPSGADPFNIELIFVDDFTDARKDLMQQAARRFEAIITQGLPDVDFSSNGFDFVADGGRVTREIGDIVDDLRIFVLKSHDGEYAGRAGPSYVRQGNPTGLPALGRVFIDTKHPANLVGYESIRQEENWGRDLMLHEIAHVLGFGTLWQAFGLVHETSGHAYFSGELAVRAFNTAGGEPYVGNKVPVESRHLSGGCGAGGHWNPYVFRGFDRLFGAEIMEENPAQEHALSAITIQSLADLGYVIDVNQADPYRLPATIGSISPLPASAKPIASREVDVGVASVGPIYVGDEQGNIILTIDD